LGASHCAVSPVSRAGDGSLQLLRDGMVIGTEQHLFSKEALKNSEARPSVVSSVVLPSQKGRLYGYNMQL
jgi:hypothetical protein